MTPARRVRAPEEARLLVVERSAGASTSSDTAALASHLREADLVVVNDSATLPASLWAEARGERVEVRLARRDAGRHDVFWAVLLGAGDHHQPTEARGAAPSLSPGDVLVGEGLTFTVIEVDRESPRLVRVSVTSERPVVEAVVRAGAPVQYAYLEDELALWDVSTAFASRPWSFEMPSATRLVTLAVAERLRRRGVELVAITHGAGLTSTGDAALDARLPFPEPYEIGERAARAVREAKARGGRVIAAGTSVVRALEGSFAARGAVVADHGETAWLGREGVPLHVVDGILTGLHVEGESHFDLLRAFATRHVLAEATARLDREGWLAHEFGDAMLLLPDRY